MDVSDGTSTPHHILELLEKTFLKIHESREASQKNVHIYDTWVWITFRHSKTILKRCSIKVSKNIKVLGMYCTIMDLGLDQSDQLSNQALLG